MRSRNSYGRDCIEGAPRAWGVPQARQTWPGQTWGVPWDGGAACKVMYTSILEVSWTFHHHFCWFAFSLFEPLHSVGTYQLGKSIPCRLMHTHICTSAKTWMRGQWLTVVWIGNTSLFGCYAFKGSSLVLNFSNMNLMQQVKWPWWWPSGDSDCNLGPDCQ